jgi:hypothetical protein
MAAAFAHMIATAGALPVLALSLLTYAIALAVYRLYLHPLAKFPGPRIAAITSWYEGYYEVVRNGQYSRKISKLHDEYGQYFPFWLTIHNCLFIDMSQQAQSSA